MDRPAGSSPTGQPTGQPAGDAPGKKSNGSNLVIILFHVEIKQVFIRPHAVDRIEEDAQ
jgi:hypothetical protein